MATPGKLVETVAQVQNVSEVTIASYYRSLREAGLVTKGGRGRSAARMTANDAALLLIAVGGSRFEKEAAEKTVKDYSRILVSHTARRMALPTGERPGWLDGEWIQNDAGTWVFDGFNIPHLQALPKRHTFLAALVALIEAAMNGEFGDVQHKGHPNTPVTHFIEVSLYGPEPHAGISIGLYGRGFVYTEEGGYLVPDRIEKNEGNHLEVEDKVRRQYGGGDLEIRRAFTFRTIYEVANILKS